MANSGIPVVAVGEIGTNRIALLSFVLLHKNQRDRSWINRQKYTSRACFLLEIFLGVRLVMPAPEGGMEIGLETASASRDASRPCTPACSAQSTLLARQPLLPTHPGPRQPCMGHPFSPVSTMVTEALSCPVSPGSADRQRWRQVVFGCLVRSTLCCSSHSK